MPLDSKILCLGALDAGFETGYDIRKAFEEGPFQHFQSLSYGSIYPALNALLSEGLVTCTACSADGRRDRKVYAITESGRAALKAALLGPLAEDQLRSDAMFALAFTHLITPTQALRIVDEYTAANRRLAEELGRLLRDKPCTAPGHRFLLRLGEEGCLGWARCIETMRDGLLAELDGDSAEQLRDADRPADAPINPGGEP